MTAPQLYVGTGSAVSDRVFLSRERWGGFNRRGAGKRCLLPAPGGGMGTQEGRAGGEGLFVPHVTRGLG